MTEDRIDGFSSGLMIIRMTERSLLPPLFLSSKATSSALLRLINRGVMKDLCVTTLTDEQHMLTTLMI